MTGDLDRFTPCKYCGYGVSYMISTVRTVRTLRMPSTTRVWIAHDTWLDILAYDMGHGTDFYHRLTVDDLRAVRPDHYEKYGSIATRVESWDDVAVMRDEGKDEGKAPARKVRYREVEHCGECGYCIRDIIEECHRCFRHAGEPRVELWGEIPDFCFLLTDEEMMHRFSKKEAIE